MIKILITREKKNIKHINVSGHGGSKRGKDIICAGVSAITQTALSGLLHYGEDLLIWESTNGLLDIKIAHPSDPQQKIIFNAILIIASFALARIFVV